MTSTLQLRALRTFLNSHAITLPIGASSDFVSSSSRQQRVRVHQRWRTFATSPPLGRSSKHQAISTVAKYGEFPKTTSISPNSYISPTVANPPATTRPPPLELPERTPETSTISHLFKTGKAYLAFYKTGLKNIYYNTRLVWSLDAAGGIPPDPAGRLSPTFAAIARPPVKRVPKDGSTTRSRQLLQRRWTHDITRLPLFALILLICGEFTPFVVLALPGAVPFTCRIPRQVEGMQRKTEERRQRSFTRLARIGGAAAANHKKGRTVAIAHIARSLNLISPLWDRIAAPDAIVASYPLAGRKVSAHLAFLEEDTRLLRQGGGVDALEEPEVVLACIDRGINVLGSDVTQLRGRLREWMKYVYKDKQVGDPISNRIRSSLVRSKFQ